MLSKIYIFLNVCTWGLIACVVSFQLLFTSHSSFILRLRQQFLGHWPWLQSASSRLEQWLEWGNNLALHYKPYLARLNWPLGKKIPIVKWISSYVRDAKQNWHFLAYIPKTSLQYGIRHLGISFSLTRLLKKNLKKGAYIFCLVPWWRVAFHRSIEWCFGSCD